MIHIRDTQRNLQGGSSRDHKDRTDHDNNNIHHTIKYARRCLNAAMYLYAFCLNTEEIRISLFKFLIFDVRSQKILPHGFRGDCPSTLALSSPQRWRCSLNAARIFSDRSRYKQHQWDYCNIISVSHTFTFRRIAKETVIFNRGDEKFFWQ